MTIKNTFAWVQLNAFNFLLLLSNHSKSEVKRYILTWLGNSFLLEKWHYMASVRDLCQWPIDSGWNVFKELTRKLNKLLTQFQTDRPMAPFLAETLYVIAKFFMEKLVLKCLGESSFFHFYHKKLFKCLH